MKDFEEIMEEVKTYEPVKLVDGLEKNPDMQSIDIEDKVTLWGETDIRNDVLKTAALAVFTGACAYLDLMAAALYIPVGVACLCNICYKFGVYRGRTEV